MDLCAFLTKQNFNDHQAETQNFCVKTPKLLIFQSSYRKNTSKKQKAPLLTYQILIQRIKLFFRTGSVNKPCDAGVHQGTYLGRRRFTATSPPQCRPGLVHPTALPQAGLVPFSPGKTSSPPWLTPRAGNALPHRWPRAVPRVPAALHPILWRVSRP